MSYDDSGIALGVQAYHVRDEDDYQPRVEWVPRHQIIIPPPTVVKNWALDKTLRQFLEIEGKSREQWIREAVTSTVSAPVPGGVGDMVPWMPGHRMDLRHRISADMYGPCEGIKLMIIATSPEAEGHTRGKHLYGGPCRFITDRLAQWGVPEEEVYVTSVCRFSAPRGEKKIKDAWCKAAYELVAAEAMTVSPDVILCLGAPAVKALWGASAKMTAWRGTPREWEHWHNTPTVVTANPVQFMLGYAGKESWENDVDMAIRLAFGDRDFVHIEHHTDTDKEYLVAEDAEGFEILSDYILRQNPKLLVFDCEWGNDHGRQEFGYTISTQVSWGEKKAAFFKFRQPGSGEVIHSAADWERCKAALKRLLQDSDAQIGGHNLRVDVKELLKHGINLRHKMRSGLDSMLIHHLLHQDDDQGLDVLVRKYAPTLGAYWSDLEDFLDSTPTSKSPGRGEKLRHGYRDVPAHILEPYGMIDADATYRCLVALLEEWSGPEFARLRKLYYDVVMPSNDGLLEIELTGIRLDLDRMRVLRGQFDSQYREILDNLRERIGWGDRFNARSTDHICTLLFYDTDFKGAADKRSLVPEGGTAYCLEPLCNTDKYPKDWWMIKQFDEERYNRPSTKAEVLKILVSQLTNKKTGLKRNLAEYNGLLGDGFGDPSRVGPLKAQLAEVEDQLFVVQAIHDLKVLAQFLNNFLKQTTPSKEQQKRLDEFFSGMDPLDVSDETLRAASLVPDELDYKGDPIIVNEDGKSFLECVSQRTGRVSGSILQTTDTGRARMFQANLQVFPKKQEKEIERIFRGSKVDKVKSCVIPRSPGADGEEWVVTEADFKQAENWIMAIAGHDEAMLKILAGGRDLHSENCFNAFKVDMPKWWGWNGSDPEEGEATTKSGNFEFVRPVPSLIHTIDHGTGEILPVVNGQPGEGLCDYVVWAAVIKALYPDKRTAAKTISFGVPYGRQARALAREIRKAGIEITDEQAEELVEAFYRDYPGVAKLLQTARDMAIHPDFEYVETLFGRRRYFTGASQLGRLKQSSAQREAGNFPIQGCVADLLYQALNNFMAFKYGNVGPEFNILLVVHDAVILEHRRRDIPEMYQVIKASMSDWNPIPHTGGKMLGVDIESFGRWGDGKTLVSKDAYQPDIRLN